jgi:hypothetical protein
MPRYDFSGFNKSDLVRFQDALQANDFSGFSRDELIAFSNAIDPPPPPPEVGLLEDTAARLGIGYNQLEIAINNLAKEVGLIGEDTAARWISENYRDIQDYAKRTDQEVSEAITKLGESKSFGEVWQQIKDDPLGFSRSALAVSAESLPISLPMLAAGAAGLMAGPAAPVVSAALAGGVSGAVEYALSLNEAVSDAGLDPSKPEDLQKFFDNDKLMADARERAAMRGLGVSAFDALSFGIANRILGPTSRAVRAIGKRMPTTARVAGTTLGLTGELAAQAAAGGAGEAAAQYLSGEEITAGPIALEAAGELVPGLAEIGVKRAIGVPLDPAARAREEEDAFRKQGRETQRQRAYAAQSLSRQGIVDFDEGEVSPVPGQPPEGVAGALEPPVPPRDTVGERAAALAKQQGPAPLPDAVHRQPGTRSLLDIAYETTTPFTPKNFDAFEPGEQEALSKSRLRRGAGDVRAPVELPEVREVLGEDAAQRFIQEQKPLTQGTGAVIPTPEGPEIVRGYQDVNEMEFDLAASMLEQEGRVTPQTVKTAIEKARGKPATDEDVKNVLVSMVLRGVLADRTGRIQSAHDEGRDPTTEIPNLGRHLRLSNVIGVERRRTTLPEGTQRDFAIQPVTTETRGKEGQWTYEIDGDASGNFFANRSDAQKAAKEAAGRRRGADGAAAKPRIFKGREDVAIVERARDNNGNVVGQRVREVHTPRTPEQAGKLREIGSSEAAKAQPDLQSAKRLVGAALPLPDSTSAEAVRTKRKASEAYRERMAPVVEALRKTLDSIGLKDVGLRVRNVIMSGDTTSSVEGYAQVEDGRVVITLASDIYDPNLSAKELTEQLAKVMNHEVIHALVNLGVISENEYKTLARYARNKKSRYGISFRRWAEGTYKGRPVEEIEEESIAEAFREFSDDPSRVTGRPAAIFRKVVKFFRALGNWMRGNGFRAAEDVFGSIKSGEVGARRRVGNIAGARRLSKRVSGTDGLGFYSRTAQSIQDYQDKFSASQLRSFLKKRNLPPDELKWTGLDEFLAKDRKLTKQEVMDFLEANNVEIEEVTYLDPDSRKKIFRGSLVNDEIDSIPVLVGRFGEGAIDAWTMDAVVKTRSQSEPGERLEAIVVKYINMEGSADIGGPTPTPRRELFMRGLRNGASKKLTSSPPEVVDGIVNAIKDYEAGKISNLGDLEEAVEEYSGTDYFIADILFDFARTWENNLPQAGMTVYKVKGDGFYTKDQPEVIDDFDAAGDLAHTVINDTLGSLFPEQVAAQERASREFASGSGRARFQDYTVTGGENYREVLLTVSGTTFKKGSFYEQAHFAPGNIAVFFRLKDRIDADGKRMLFIEEIQSDWGQRGRDEGFRGEKLDEGKLKKLEDAFANVYVEKKQELYTQYAETGEVGNTEVGNTAIMSLDEIPEGALFRSSDLPASFQAPKSEARFYAMLAKMQDRGFFTNEQDTPFDEYQRARHGKGELFAEVMVVPPISSRTGKPTLVANVKFGKTEQEVVDARVNKIAGRDPEVGDAYLNFTKYRDRTFVVPKGPFVEDTNKWLTLALKRIVKLAVDGEYSGIGWTPASVQVERYWSEYMIEAQRKLPGMRKFY